MLAAWSHCGPQLWAVLVTLRDFAYSTENGGGELAVQLNRREKWSFGEKNMERPTLFSSLQRKIGKHGRQESKVVFTVIPLGT